MNILEILERAGHAYSTTGNSNEYIFTCPLCNKKKLYLNPQKGSYICFVCNNGGGIQQLSAIFGIKLEANSKTDLATLRKLAQQEKPIVQISQSNNNVLPLEFRRILGSTSTMGRMAYDYLRKRGLPVEVVCKTWNLGYCSDGPLAGYLIIPVYDEHGECVSYQARIIFGDGPKNKNPLGSNGNLFNIHRAIGYAGIVLLEGPFDAFAADLRLSKHGVGSIALLGHNLSKLQAFTLSAVLKPKIVWLMLDPDIDLKEMHTTASQLVTAGIEEVFVAQVDKDPDECSEHQLLTALETSKRAILFKKNYKRT